MSDLGRLRKKLSANKNVVQGLIVKGKEAMARERSTDTVGEIAAYLKTIRSKESLLEDLCDKICDLVEEDKIDEVVDDATKFEVSIAKDVLRMEEYVLPPKGKDVKPGPVVSQASSSGSSNVHSRVKLPKIVIKKFTGDPTAWQQFFEIFEASVGECTDLSDIEKFSYLKSNLGGDAEKCIEGMELTNSNYPLAMDLLKERFGNRQLVIQSHMHKFVQLKRIHSGRNVKDLRILLDQLESHVRSLHSVGIEQEHYGPMLIPVLLEKLPDDIKLEISRALGKSEWKIKEFVAKLKDDVTARESCFLMTKATGGGDDEDVEIRKKTTGALVANTKGMKCAFCAGNHFSDKCAVISDVDERVVIVKSQKLCFKCLAKGHAIRSCKSKRNCFACKKANHHTAICPTWRGHQRSDGSSAVQDQPGGLVAPNVAAHLAAAPPATTIMQPPVRYGAPISGMAGTIQPNARNAGMMRPAAHGTIAATAAHDTGTASTLHVNSSTAVLLQTARVVVTDIHGLHRTPTETRILLDLCSQRTYITTRLAEKLQLSPIDTQGYVVNSFGNEHGRHQVLNRYKFCLKSQKRNCVIEVTGNAVPFICAPLSDQRVDLAKELIPFLNNLDLSDPGVGGDNEAIEVLIGADYYWSIVSDEKRRCGIRGLVAVNSKLGWLLSGPCAPSNPKAISTNFVSQSLGIDNEEDQLLSKQVEKFHDLESLGIAKNEISVYEKFLEKVTFQNHRYCVELPFKEDFPRIEDNYVASVSCLQRLKRKLDEQPDLRRQYDEIMQSQLKLGIIERVNAKPISGCWTSLPHQAVIRKDKPTTQVRVVYNCSFKKGKKKKSGTRSKYSCLNECVYKGPSLNPLLYDILLRYRTFKVAISADIEAAYLQIEVAPKHRDYMRIVWYDDVNLKEPEIVQYRFTRVIFGATSSSFLLNGVVRLHAEKYRAEDPEFPDMIKRSLYADDFNGGAPTAEKGKEVYDKVKWRFLDGSFNFRKWRTNNAELRAYIDLQEKIEPSVGELTGGKNLGIKWDEDRDVFIISVSDFVKDAENVEPTKRQILRVESGVFDPIGFLQPLVIKWKILFQSVCASGMNWDDPPDDNVKRKYSKIVKEFRKAQDIIIPRRYCLFDSIQRVELHGFSDASMQAYGACIYLKFVASSGEVAVSFVTSKSRIAPIREEQTLPRLELLGILVLSKLMSNVFTVLSSEMLIAEQCYWSDSEVSIGWCKAESKEFNTFVQNRVTRIRKTIDVSKLRHCSGDENPADLVTRDVYNINNELWWNGPAFLKENSNLGDEVEDKNSYVNTPGFYEEVKTQKTSLHVAVANDASIGDVINIHGYSNLLKLFRVTAYVKRFVYNLKAKRNNEQLRLDKYVSRTEISEARLLWIKDNQRSFTKKHCNDLKVQLNVHPDSDSVLRSYSRLKHAKIPQDSKSPALINSKHKLAELIVQHAHTRVLHRGVKQTLTETRTAYWIPRGRSFVRKLLRPCVVCKKLHARSYKYPGHSDLPEFRLDDGTPFKATGVDYLGPLFCRPVYGDPKSSVTHKCWIAIYTCASTRAVILDVVQDAKAPTFVESFTRFISRRGCPNTMISDHGSVFTAKETQTFASNRFINWKFTLEAAPWFGGMWERLVASVKRCLKKVIGVKVVTYVELQTLLFQVEAILNNRPIDADYEDDREEVLTPNHLVFGRRLETMNSGDEKEVSLDGEKCTPVRRKRLVDTMLNHFWQRWRKEYLTSLRQFQRNTKINKGSQQIQIGDIVVIFDEKQRRHLWEIGRVTNVIISGDGKIRGAVVKVGRSGVVINRPITKLYPLITNDKLNSNQPSVQPNAQPDAAKIATSDVEEQAIRDDTNNASRISNRNVDTPDDRFDDPLAMEPALLLRNVDTEAPMTSPSANANRRVRRNAAVLGELQRRLNIE